MRGGLTEMQVKCAHDLGAEGIGMSVDEVSSPDPSEPKDARIGEVPRTYLDVHVSSLDADDEDKFIRLKCTNPLELSLFVAWPNEQQTCRCARCAGGK